jgi:hypothetical protein
MTATAPRLGFALTAALVLTAAGFAVAALCWRGAEWCVR